MAQVLNMLDGMHFSDFPHDMVGWKLDSTGRFTLKSSFTSLPMWAIDHLLMFVGFPWSIVFKSFAPLK